ncbi:MAG: hypothetical protein NE328_02775 [Lentisphaeraceae bacterium]|nr:hypothetical protein [Lentisphaeraceae bacterium]
MDSEVQNALNSILSVDGITGAMAVNNEREILGALMPNLYTEENLNEVSDLTINTYATLKLLKIRPDDMIFDYEGMQVFVKDLRGKGLLLVMNESDVSSSFLNIATNMARKNIVNYLNNKNKKVKALNTTTQPVTSTSRGALMSYQTTNNSNNISVNEEGIELNDEMTVFNKLLKSIYECNSTEFPDSVEDLNTQLKNIIKSASFNPILNAELSEWIEKKGQKLIVTHLSKADMHKIIHPLHIFLCEYHGPIEGEMIMKTALSESSNCPESKRFSPRNLL